MKARLAVVASSVLALVFASGCAMQSGSPDAEEDTAPASVGTARKEAEAPPLPSHDGELTSDLTGKEKRVLHVVDAEGNEARPLTPQEAEKVIPPHRAVTDANQIESIASFYLPCNSLAYPGQEVECGTQFFGETSIYAVNCSKSAPAFIKFQGIGYIIPATPSNWVLGCQYLDFSGSYWGANVVTQVQGATPVYVEH